MPCYGPGPAGDWARLVRLALRRLLEERELTLARWHCPDCTRCPAVSTADPPAECPDCGAEDVGERWAPVEEG